MKKAIGLSIYFALSWLGGHNSTSYTPLFIGIAIICAFEMALFAYKSIVTPSL